MGGLYALVHDTAWRAIMKKTVFGSAEELIGAYVTCGGHGGYSLL